MTHRKFATLVVEDLGEEEPIDKSSKPKKVCGPPVTHRPRVILTEWERGKRKRNSL